MPKRASRLRCLAAIAVFSITTVASAQTDPPAAGAEALSSARAAWDRGRVEQAEASYREAIEKGGLAPNEVLEGYVRLGVARARRGKKEQAVAAFRAAAILDAGFTLPDGAGARATELAARGKSDVASLGSLALTATAPDAVPSGAPFKVTATLDAAHVRVVPKLRLLARDKATGKTFEAAQASAESVDFEVPTSMTLPGATVNVRVDALDSHANRIASIDRRVTVADLASAAVATPAPSDAPPRTREKDEKKGGFWSSPWPYVVGGAVLAGAGAAFYLQTRPTDDVTVGTIGVRAR